MGGGNGPGKLVNDCAECAGLTEPASCSIIKNVMLETPGRMLPSPGPSWPPAIAHLFESGNRGFVVTGRRGDQSPGLRILLIGVVILSVIHVPLPQADYHNVRHHDGTGEVCAHHDHLLRWHPTAELDADVTLLHWHWFLPQLDGANPHQRSDDDHHRPGSGPALHAHVGDGLVPDDWRGEPFFQTAGFLQLMDQLALDGSIAGALVPSPTWGGGAGVGVLAGRVSFCGGVRAQRTVLFQRWNC
jgi:hypothetical protein